MDFISEDHLQEMLIECYHIKDSDKIGLKKSNNGGYHSKDIQNNNVYKELFKEITKEVTKYANELSLNNITFHLENAWVNINSKGDSNARHMHHPGAISGVYYLEVPEGLCGNLELYNDNSSKKLSMMQQNVTKWHLINQSIYELHPIVNNLVLFPSWQEHAVGVNNTNKERVSISFNYV